MTRHWPRFFLVISLVLASCVAVAPAFAQGDWTKLGERTVNGRIDKDSIEMGRGSGVYTAIQLKVEGSALQMFDVRVVFGNGESFSPNTRFIFDKNNWTRVIDLPGEKRILQRIEFRYGNLPGGGSARVEVWGKVAGSSPRRLTMLGSRTVNGRADRDAIEVGAEDGLFTAILVRIDGSALMLFEVRVVFGDGESFSPNTRLVFDKDDTSRLIDLPGNRRVIKRVEFRYGNLPRGGNARIELWGMR